MGAFITKGLHRRLGGNCPKLPLRTDTGDCW